MERRAIGAADAGAKSRPGACGPAALGLDSHPRRSRCPTDVGQVEARDRHAQEQGAQECRTDRPAQRVRCDEVDLWREEEQHAAHREQPAQQRDDDRGGTAPILVCGDDGSTSNSVSSACSSVVRAAIEAGTMQKKGPSALAKRWVRWSASARELTLVMSSSSNSPTTVLAGHGSPQQPTGPANRVFGLLPPASRPRTCARPSHGGTFAHLDEVLRRMPPRSPRRMLAAMSQDLPMIVAPAVPPVSARR